jgi:hypothetical protein
MSTEHESKTKPRRCPTCGGTKVASILYGYPAMDEKVMARIDRGELVLGGCCVTERDPAWLCVDCEAHIYRKDDASPE